MVICRSNLCRSGDHEELQYNVKLENNRNIISSSLLASITNWLQERDISQIYTLSSVFRSSIAVHFTPFLLSCRFLFFFVYCGFVSLCCHCHSASQTVHLMLVLHITCLGKIHTLLILLTRIYSTKVCSLIKDASFYCLHAGPKLIVFIKLWKLLKARTGMFKIQFSVPSSNSNGIHRFLALPFKDECTLFIMMLFNLPRIIHPVYIDHMTLHLWTTLHELIVVVERIPELSLKFHYLFNIIFIVMCWVTQPILVFKFTFIPISRLAVWSPDLVHETMPSGNMRLNMYSYLFTVIPTSFHYISFYTSKQVVNNSAAIVLRLCWQILRLYL